MHTLTRSHSDRRSGKERRKSLSLHRFRYKGSERRAAKERRSQFERRNGWVRISKWSSIKMRDLKIARYLIRSWSTAVLPVLFWIGMHNSILQSAVSDCSLFLKWGIFVCSQRRQIFEPWITVKDFHKQLWFSKRTSHFAFQQRHFHHLILAPLWFSYCQFFSSCSNPHHHYSYRGKLMGMVVLMWWSGYILLRSINACSLSWQIKLLLQI